MAICEMPGRSLEPLDLEPSFHLDLPLIAGPKMEVAHAYLADRKRYITTDPDIFGGVPIIRGTRIPVHAVRRRLADDDMVDDLLQDYPEIPREAFIAADIYARTHSEGRPVWRQAALGRPLSPA